MEHVEIVHTLTDIDEADWNGLVGEGDFYSSYQWLHSHDSLPGLKSAYVLLRSGAHFLAAAPVSFAKHDIATAYSQQHFNEVFGEQLRFALLGTRRGYRSSLLIADLVPPEERKEITAELVRAALRVSAEWGAESLVTPYAPAETVAALSAADVIGRTKEVDTEAVLILTGGNFEDYLGSLPSHRRVSIRHERAALRAMGLTLRVEDVRPGCTEELAGLLAQVERKYGRHATVNGLRRYLTSTFEGDPQHARLFTCRDAGGRLLSAMLAYEWGQGLYARATATDYESLPRGSFAYFNVVYYEPIEYCLSHGLTSLYFGVGAMDTKRARGCQQLPLRHVLLTGT
ncbi:GNAT family N-acetyltransferase [Streptomyces sp. SP17KL33]|uniref:GNAT family N-acetyltransferase n=1 Tax=Streptomyces sp. SP17KL33 TaxID=3002534 RepID=UPI002E7652B9|nr:GNAT family N-acetyltransferase [Streptomyces sp. SP17KL33]MEE1831708.1 GNAT family N-acetyltransferase [Streptomyces sp. SP17KL33]